MACWIHVVAYVQQLEVLCGDEFEPQDVSDLLDKLVVKFPHHAIFVSCLYAYAPSPEFEYLGHVSRASSGKHVYFKAHRAQPTLYNIINRFDCTCSLWNGEEIATSATIIELAGVCSILFVKPILIIADGMFHADLYVKLTCAKMRVGDGAFRLNASRFFYSRTDEGTFEKHWMRYWFKDHIVHVVSGFKISTDANFRCHYMDDYQSLVKLCRALLLMLKSKCKIIQRAWRNCISNPEFKICRKRLLMEYNDGL